MFKKILLLVLTSLFFVNSNAFAIVKECSLPAEASGMNIYYKFILQDNYPKYIQIVDRVLEKFSKKIANKTFEQKILIYKKINYKIKNIFDKVKNPVSKNVIWYLAEEIDNNIIYLDLKICEKIVSWDSNIDFISNMKVEKDWKNLKIFWDLVFWVDKVVVTYENAWGEFPIDIYKLHNFKPWERKFKYNASYNFKNLDNWTNYYKITAYIWEKKYSKTTTYKENSIVKVEKNISKKMWKYCVLDTCLDSSAWEILEENEKFVQEKTSSYILKNKSEIFKQIEDWLEMETIFIKDLDRIFVKIQEWWACGSNSIKQEFFDSNAKKLSEKYLRDYVKNKYGLEKEIKIGNYIYNSKMNFKEVVSINSDEVKKMWKVSSLEEIKKLINKEIKGKEIAKRYIFVYEKLWMKFDIMYGANFIQPERLINLWTDNSWLRKKIDRDWNLLDLEVTNTVLSYFWENNVKWVTTKDWKRIFSISKTDLPVFKVKKFDNNWMYMLYSADWYKIVAFVEMCKPAVYIYNSWEEKNILTLKTDSKNYFTKLIPEFTGKNSWEFSSKNSKIEVKWKNYDYLYYAIKVKNYSHNKNGWIVSGKNIKKFFEDKLEKINFNKKEKEDFLDYWLSKYDKNKYYFVSFKYKEDLEKLVSLEFAKKPNKIFRVLLDSYELEELKKENENFLYSKIWNKFDKFLIKRFDRNNSDYEVFEWGGVLEKDGEVFVY